MGMNSENIFIGTIGDAVELNQNYMKQLPSVPAGRILVDGLGVGDVGSIVLRDRKHLAEDGLIVVVCTISEGDGHVVAGPDVVSRGFVYVRESERLMVESRDLVTRVLEECAENQIHDWGTLKTRIKDDLSKLLYEKNQKKSYDSSDYYGNLVCVNQKHSVSKVPLFVYQRGYEFETKGLGFVSNSICTGCYYGWYDCCQLVLESYYIFY